jgi:TLC domain
MEYFLHHYLTAALIYFSYTLYYLPVGAAVMLLHDITDLSVSFFKLTIDVTPITIQLTGYMIMVVSWIYFRIWFFPAHVIGRIIEECSACDNDKLFDKNFAFMTVGFLIALACMHVFWLYLMIRGLIRRCNKHNWIDQVSLKGTENRSS